MCALYFNKCCCGIYYAWGGIYYACCCVVDKSSLCSLRAGEYTNMWGTQKAWRANSRGWSDGYVGDADLKMINALMILVPVVWFVFRKQIFGEEA